MLFIHSPHPREPHMHTKGPWYRNIKPAAKYPTIFAGRNTHVAQVTTVGLSPEEIEANCNLIMAAPELLDALVSLRKELRAHVKMNVRKHYSLMIADVSASKAIAKATEV